LRVASSGLFHGLRQADRLESGIDPKPARQVAAPLHRIGLPGKDHVGGAEAARIVQFQWNVID